MGERVELFATLTGDQITWWALAPAVNVKTILRVKRGHG